ncbi:MAG: hypothetical protein CMN30_08930 [Sandaracinus sp.]|nr:hypothetical protein [Sandaracinus sp.]|tara:strand:+ start:2298 stop:3011 length:714 start_codon:yes stop_codon:yes gene_type:complete
MSESDPRASATPALEGGRVPPDDGPKPEPRLALGGVAILGVLLLGLVLGAVIANLTREDEVPESVDELHPTPDVIVAIEDLARLETTSFHVERVIDLVARQRQLFGLVEAEDAILLVAGGDITAGVDLTKMRDGDVVVDLETMSATVTLPPPEIFAARLDNERTYVHTRDTDALARRDPHLETRARREAERTLRESALEGGILDRARANAETAIRTLVRSMGYDTVTIRWRDANPER